MYRIDDPSAATTLPVPEAALTEGFWTEGNPGSGIPATLERASWFNMVQEELRAVVVAGGQTPSKTTYNQVLSAINALVLAYFTGGNQSLVSGGYQKLPGGLICQWQTVNVPIGPAGSGSIAPSTANFSFPIAFPSVCFGCAVTALGSTIALNSNAFVAGNYTSLAGGQVQNNYQNSIVSVLVISLGK